MVNGLLLKLLFSPEDRLNESVPNIITAYLKQFELTDKAIVANCPHIPQNIPCAAYYVEIQKSCLGSPIVWGKRYVSKVSEQVSSFKITHVIFHV